MGNITFFDCQAFYISSSEKDEILILGSSNDNRIFSIGSKDPKPKQLTIFPYNITPYGHTVVCYYDKLQNNDLIFVSFGGYKNTRHMIQYNYTTKKFLNLRRKYKLNLQKYTIIENSRANIIVDNIGSKYSFHIF